MIWHLPNFCCKTNICPSYAEDEEEDAQSSDEEASSAESSKASVFEGDEPASGGRGSGWRGRGGGRNRDKGKANSTGKSVLEGSIASSTTQLCAMTAIT